MHEFTYEGLIFFITPEIKQIRINSDFIVHEIVRKIKFLPYRAHTLILKFLILCEN
jgi:hypothetical protein